MHLWILGMLLYLAALKVEKCPKHLFLCDMSEGTSRWHRETGERAAISSIWHLQGCIAHSQAGCILMASQKTIFLAREIPFLPSSSSRTDLSLPNHKSPQQCRPAGVRCQTDRPLLMRARGPVVFVAPEMPRFLEIEWVEFATITKPFQTRGSPKVVHMLSEFSAWLLDIV